MTLALILAPLASLLWAITNHIDKHLISKISKNGDYRGLLIFSSLVAGGVLLPISFILSKYNVNLDIKTILMVFISSSIYITGSLFYFKALQKNDASIIVSIFQLIPVFGYILGLIFLKEELSIYQIMGGVLIIISSIAITYEVDKKRFTKEKLLALIYMSFSSLSYAIYFLLFRLATKSNEFYTITFWYQVGLILTGMILITLFKKYRKSFFSLVKENGKKVFGFNLLNEGLNVLANMIVNYAITLAPMAIVLVLNGFQPLFVLIIGLIGVTLFPKIFYEDTKKSSVYHKIICILISIIGLIIMYS